MTQDATPEPGFQASPGDEADRITEPASATGAENETGLETAVADPPRWRRSISFFLAGQTLSMFGSAIVGYAVMWYVTLETGSAGIFTILFLVNSIPMALTTIPGGIWADRYWRKALIIGSDAFVAVATVILALVILNGHETLWLIIGVLSLRGFAGGVQQPAVSAVLPQIVPTRHLMRVNGINSAIMALTYIAAPALAAALLALLPIGVILFVDAVTAVLGIGCTIFVAIPRVAGAADLGKDGMRGYVRHLGEAFQTVWAIPGLRRAILLFSISFLVIVPPANMTPIIIVRFYGTEEWMLAAAEMTWSIGMIVGGVIIAAWGGMRNRMTMMVAVVALWGAFTIAMGLAGNIWVFCVVMALFGLSMPGVNTPLMTSVQELIPEAMLGRVMSFVTILITIAGPLGVAIIGPLGDIVDIRYVVVGCGVIGLIVTGIFALMRGPGSQLLPPDR
ncbi:MAG: MFS transporter [Propionibacteriaceae bacterium]|jgi:DHA3 family macrolide efflux protein-like MFS transporter|nr:MFS transporter [Propionibacteriaceae bacterium]